MATSRTSSFPYPNIGDIKLKTNEPMSYMYFNAHAIRLLQNIRSLNKTTTLQKATSTQWGVTRLATVNDIISEDGDRDTAITNATMSEAIATLKDSNLNKFRIDGKLPLSKHYEWTHGEFVVGLNENVGRKITNSPDSVVYANVGFAPLDMEDNTMLMASSVKTDVESFDGFEKSAGVINFSNSEDSTNYTEFHVYYHKSGYVICRNGQIDPRQRQIKVSWSLLSRV